MKNLICTSAVALLTVLVGYQAWGHGFSTAIEEKIKIGRQSTLGQQNTPAVPVRKAKARIAVQRIYFEKDSSGVWTVVRKKECDVSTQVNVYDLRNGEQLFLDINERLCNVVVDGVLETLSFQAGLAKVNLDLFEEGNRKDYMGAYLYFRNDLTLPNPLFERASFLSQDPSVKSVILQATKPASVDEATQASKDGLIVTIEIED